MLFGVTFNFYRADDILDYDSHSVANTFLYEFAKHMHDGDNFCLPKLGGTYMMP